MEESNKKYKENNKEKQKYWQLKSQAKRFVTLANKVDLAELRELIVRRIED